MTKEQELWALRVYGERKDEVHVTLMPEGVRIVDTPIDINDDHMQTAWIHVELKSNGDAQGSVDLSKVLVEQRRSRTWLRLGKRRGTQATEERAMRMRELTVPLFNAAGKTIDSPKLRFELTPITREEKESIAETGTWRVLLTTGRCTHRDDRSIRALAFSATLGGQTQSLDRPVTLENQQSPDQRPAKTSSQTKDYLHGKEETSVFSVKQMFRFNGRWVPSEVLRVNVDVHFQGDEHAIENALANSVHHASCEIALTSSKFAAELRLGDSQHLANLKDYGVQVYVEISFEADEGPSSSARELSAMAQPGYVCFRQAKLRRFDPLALTEGDDIVGMRVKFGTSGERVCFPLLQMSDLVPSPLRKHHTDRAGTFESSSIHMLTSLYEVESFQVEIFTATGSHGECQFTYGDNETWLALSGQQGQVYLAWDFVPMAAPETELDQERSDAWLVAIMTNRIIGLGAASSLGPSDVFVEIHMLDPGNTLGAEAVATHKFRTMTRDPRDIFAESSQCVLSSKFAPGQNRMPRTSLLRFEMKSARNVLLGECTIDISSLYCVASANKTGITVPLHCTAGKLFLDVILDVVQLSHAAAWIRDRNRGIRGPRKTSTPSQSEAIIEVIGAQKLRHAKGLLKTSVSETNRPTNAQITRSQPHGGASNPEWEEEKLTLDAEDIAHKRFVCESLLSKTGQVWLLTARLFANDKLLGASTWIEIPRHKDLTQVRPILYKGRFAGLLEVTASEQVQSRENAEECLSLALSSASPSAHTSGRGHDLPSSATASASASASLRRRRRSSLACSDSQGDNFVFVRVLRIRRKRAESVVVHGSLEIAARIRVDQTWYMTQFCKSMTPQSPTQVLVFQQRLGPYRLEGTALGFEAEIAIIESTSGEVEERVIGCVQLHFVAQHLHACSYKIPDTDMHIDLLVERFPSRGEAEGPDIELAESSLYEAVLNVPKEFDLSLETLVFSADAIIPCRPLQTALNNQIVCLGLGQPALRSSFESLRLTASQSDGTLIEATYEVHQNELRLLMSEAGTHSLPSVFTWSFHETRYVSLLPMLESDDFFSLNVERVEGLPSTWRSCRVRLVLISAKGPSYDVAGLCANVSLSEGSAFIAEEFHFERFGRVAPVGLRIVVLGDGGDASLETYAPVRKLAQAHFQIKVSDEASVSFSREEHATPDSHLPSREKNNTRVMNDPQLEPFVAAFARFDPKESGSIPAGVVAQLVGEELAFLLSDRNEQNLALELALLDTNSDGVVTFDEYLAWVETKRPASSVPAVPPPKAAHHLNVRLSISHVECSSQLNARVIAKALPSGAKDATSSATGPRMTWPKPAVLKIPCEKNLELFLVENHTGKVRAKSSLLEPEQLPDTLLLHGAPVKVRIEVTCARGLRAADNVGFIASHIGRGDTASSDPYCVVRVGKLSKRTKVCKDTCDPDWNESLEFDVDPGAHSSDQQNAFVAVQIEVRDKDTMSLRDDFLGSCEMHCTADLTQETLSLQGKNARGTLTLRAQITAFETAKLSLQSEIVTDITVDVLDRAIAKRTATLNEALRYSDEADQMLSKIPAPFRATKPKLAFELTPRPPKDGRRSLRRLVEAVNQASAMPPSTLVKLHEEIQDRIFAFSSEHFGHVRGRAQRPPANPREYDVLLQLSGQLREHMRQSKGICIIGELKALRTLPSTKNADVILRELVSSEEALRAHISSQLSKLSSQFDPQEAHAKRLLSELTQKGDIPTAMDLEETVRMWTEERKQRDHSARQERELAEYIENKQGELGSALGRRRDHLRTSSRADVLYAQNLAGTRHDAIESLRKSLAQADDRAERASSAALKNRLARLQSLETLLAKFEPPGSTELLAALHAASLDRETTPVTLVELTASLLYPAIMDAVLTAHELAVRFVYAGAPEVNDAKRFFRLLKRRMVRDHRKKVLHEAVCARLDALGGRNDIDAWTIMRASDLAKSFIVGGDAEDVDGESLSESARQQAIKLIKDSFLSRADLLRMGGILHVEANCSQHSLRASLDGNDLAILAGDQTSIPDEHRVEIPPQSKAEGVLHVDLLPFDPQATHFTRIMYHLEDLMQRPGVALWGHFQAQELELKRVGQGLVRIEVILSASNAALALQCFVQGSFPIPGFISREHDMSCTWNLSSSSHEKKDLFFPGRDCRATSNVEVFAALFDRENMAQPLGGPVPLRLDMDSPQSIGEGIGVKLSFQPDDNLLDRIRKERAAVKMTALGRGFLARRGAQLLGTAEFNLQASGLVGKTGSRHPSMSVYCSVHYGDIKLAATNAAKRMGASPDFGQIRLPIYKGWDGALAFKVWEQASLVGQCELSAAQLAATQASEEVTLALRGGLRSKQGAGLQVHVVRARTNLNFAPPDTMCSVRLLTSERGQGNKRTTRPRPVNASSTVEWNEGFIYRDWTFGVEEELRFEMCNSENEHVEVFTLRLENVLSQQKHTEWLKCSSSQSSLLVKAWALEVLDDPDRCGNLKITDMKLLDTVTSHPQPQPHPTSLSGPCKVIVHVLEARDLGEDACRPKVRCELLPWGQARPLGCGETGRTWSDGSHARWTRSEMNKLELSYPGSDGRDSPAIEIELWNAEHEPIVGHARVPFHSFSDDMWINLNPRGRIRFRVKVDADEGRLASARRVEASMCFKPRLNASNSKLNSSELHQEASDLMLLEELKMVSAEDLVQHVAQTPRLLTAQNELRRTALHQAVIMNQPKLAHILLEAGANLSAVDTQDKTPVDYARSADMLRALGVLAPHSVLVSQRSQMQGLETVLQHLSLRDKAFATAELVESEDTSQEKDDDDTGKEADTDGNDDEVLDNGDLVRRSSPTDDQSGKNEVLPAAEEAMFELLYDVVEQANGPDEVFDLFDMDGNGWVDGDEFEGSMRELLSIQSAADDRLEIVRSLAKMLMPSKGRPCSRRRFAAFFKEHARDARQSSARSDSSQLADHLAKILANTSSLSIHSTATSARNAVEDSTGERFDLDVVRQAWLKTLAREEREFEDVIACFVRKARGESQKWPTTMELSVFVEAVAASRDSGDDSDNIEAPARFIERLCERLHIDETEVPAREIVERMLVTNGRADEEIVTRANDHLLQSIVELVRREGHGGSVNDFRSISRRLFETLDGNGSGAVDRLEFTSGMRQLGVTDASAVQQLFDMVDVNHDGRASVEEFVLHIERFIYRKQAALDSVLATLRKRTSKPERTTASSSLTNRPKVARERLASKLAWMQKKCAERDMIKGSRETETCTRYFQRSDKALSTLHEVRWSALVVRDNSGSKRSNRSFEEVRISCYDEMDELLILDTGKSLRLGADAIEMVWDSEASGTGGRGDGSLYGSAADPEPLLVRVLAKLEACKARVHRSACRVQNLFRRNHELLKGRLAVAKQRQHVQRVRDERKGATSMQRIVRGRQARKRKARLQMLARRQAERREAEFRAAQRIQATMRGYMERNDVMERREARRLAAVVQIQSCARGFLLRSAERRLTQREHDFIIRAVQTPFRKGFMAQLTIDAPRLAQEVLRMKLIMSPACEDSTTQLPIYGLAVEAQQSAKSNVDVEARMQALRKVLRSFGVVELESEVKVSCFRDKRGQTGVAEVLEKVILLDDEAMLMQTALDLAQEITNMHPVHDVTQVSAAIMRVMSENPALTDGPKDNVKVTGTAMFKSFRYLQDNAARSFAWVQTKAKTSNRVYTRSLELESFQGTRTNDREDAMLDQVRALALVSGQFDAYGLMRALVDGNVSVDAVQDAEATLTAQWNGIEYQICARLAFAKKRKVTAGKGYNHVPARPLCKHADLHSVLMVSRGSAAHHLTDSSLQQQTNGASVDPQVLRVDFSELEMGERSAKLLQRAVWMPPAKTKVFAQRVYLHQSDVAHSGQGNGGLSVGRAGFRRVRWIGKLVTSSETSEQVEVDAWRLTEQSTGGLQLRLVIPGGHLGWFSIQECKSMLRLCLRVDVGPDDMFERTSKILSPFEETGRLLTGLLGHIRERVRDVGDARRVFLRHGFETSMPRGALEDVLKRRLECLSYLRSVEGVLDAEEAEEVMGIFLDLFPDPLTLEAWQGLCEPPIIDTLTWISRALHSRPGGLVYMRAKFRSLGDGESLALEQVESALCEYLGDVGLVPEMLREVDWTNVSVNDSICVQALLHQLDTAHKAMRMSNGEAMSPSTGMEPGTGDEAFPQEGDDEADERDLEGGAQGDAEELVTPAQRERLVQELVDSDDEEELWGSAFFRDEAMRSALAELRFRILEYANPDVHPDRFDLEKTFRVFDQDRTGLVDADEFRKALRALHMNQLLPTQEMIERFIDAMDGDGDGKINLAEFKRMVGPQRPLSLLRRLRRPHALQTIRWSVELFVADLGEWIPGTAVRYRAFDNAIQIELQAHGKQIEMQNIGFLQIDDYPLFLRRNLWSGKPWGREPLWKRVRSARSMRNSKSVLEEVFSRSSKSSSLFSSSSLGTLTTASSETPPTTARSSASSFASMSSSLTD